MRAEKPAEPGRRAPGPWRLAATAVLLALAVAVLWVTVEYGSRGQAATPADDGGSATGSPADEAATIPAATTSPVAAVSSAASMPPSASAATPTGTTAAATAATTAAGKTAAKAGTSVAVKPTTKAAAAPAATFAPIAVQAEAAGNTLSGGAAEVDCATCDGGARVRWIGRVDVHLTVAVAGTRIVTVEYESDGNRGLAMSVNGASPVVATVTGTDWTTPKSLRFTVSIPAGSVDLGFYGEGGNAPDLDKITVG